MKRIIHLFILLTCLCIGCTKKSEIEKHQKVRNKITNIHENIKEIKIEDIIIGPITPLNILNEFLIIGDITSPDNLLHVFNKNDFKYIKSILTKGEGPTEITNIGYIGTNESRNMIYISDHGKQKIFAYNLDSIINNPQYIPQTQHEMPQKQFPSKYQYINDTTCVALIIEPTGNSGYNQSIAQWNTNTGEIKKMNYEHPDIKKKRVNFTVSPENNMIVECYTHNDLMTIYKLDGNLKYNIYGPKWNTDSDNKTSYYEDIIICKNKILALYSGEETFNKDKAAVNRPTKFILFDFDGNYIQTLETQYPITNFCYDKKNDRIIMSLDDEIQFAYFDLHDLK